MNILPISVNSLKFNSKYNNISKPVNNNLQSLNITKLSNVYYPVSFGNSKFGYKPISSKRPDYELLNCDYSDSEEFSNLYASKINSQLRTIEYPDIMALLERLKIKTGADEKLIVDVLYQLTMYSNYNALRFIQETASKLNAGSLGVASENSNKTDDISINTTLLNYFSNNKSFLGLNRSKKDKSMVILDGMLLDELEESKKNNTQLYKRFISELKAGYAVPVILKGFDIECSDKKYRSAAFLYGSGNLEDIAQDTIKRIQRGENLDDILFLNMEKRYKNLIANDIEKEKQEVEICSPNTVKNPNKYSIYKNLKTPKLEPEKVKSTIEDYLARSSKSDFSEFAKYLDEFSVAHSFDSIACELKKLYQQIKNKYNDSVLYGILYPNKSELLLTHLYHKINNIPPSRFIGCAENSENKKLFLHKNNKKLFVIDDMSLSGETVLISSGKINNALPLESPPNYGLLLASYESFSRLYYACCDTNVLYMRQAKTPDDKSELLNEQEVDKLPLNIGHKNGKYLIVFPYIIPDNCSNIAGDLFGGLLIENNHYSNKAPL